MFYLCKLNLFYVNESVDTIHYNPTKYLT